jgi:hypothetical protein
MQTSKLNYDKTRRTIIVQPRGLVWLRNVGDEDECWVPCAKGDSGAIAFVPLSNGQRGDEA